MRIMLTNLDQTFEARLENALKSKASLPVLNPDAARIQMAATQKDLHFSILAGLLCKDPVLTTQILKVANSPYYRGRAVVETLKDALTLLGQYEMVNIIMTVVHKQNFRSKVPLIKSFQERLWTHSVNCATGALWTTRHLDLKDLIPKAFIAGLLHDMGKLHILAALESLLVQAHNRPVPPLGAIEHQIERRHTALGYDLLTQWHLPTRYGIVAKDHHSDSFDSSNLLLVVVRLVDRLCKTIEDDVAKQTTCHIDHSAFESLPEARILNLGKSEIGDLETAIRNSTVSLT